MSQVNRYTVAVTTAADGSAAVYTPALTGRLVNVIYTKPAASGLDTADFVITGESTGLGIWTETGVDASKTISPTQDLHNQVGGARLYAADGEEVSGPIYLAGERVKIAITGGGNATSGSFIFIVVGPNG